MSKINLLPDADYKVKEQLYSLFYEITSQIKGRQLELNEDEYYNTIKEAKLPQIINYKGNNTSVNDTKNGNGV